MATVYVGQESTYTEAVVVRRQLEDHLDLTDPKEHPLLKAVGLNSYEFALKNTRFEWQKDYLIPLTDALSANLDTTDGTVVSVDNAEYFVLHEIILIGSELMRVESIDATANTLVVERGFAGSTAVDTAVTDAVIYRLGSARPEGSSPGWAQQVQTAQPYNFTQIFDFVVGITGTEKAEENYAPADLLAYRLDKRMAELYMLMERALIHNLRYEPATNTGRLTGGLSQFVHDTNDLSDEALDFADLEDALQDSFSRAGLTNAPNSAWMNAWIRRKISSFGADSIRTERTETTYGSVVDLLLTNFGTISLNLDHLILDSVLWLLNMDKVQMAPLQGRGFHSIDASVPGDDGEKERILGEYGIVVKGEDGANDGAHVKLYGVSTTL